MLKPTDEQQAAADAFHVGRHLALRVGAGTGRTTTLAELARATALDCEARALPRPPGNAACRRPGPGDVLRGPGLRSFHAPVGSRPGGVMPWCGPCGRVRSRCRGRGTRGG
ncbi:hypothetical protein CW362_00270 [Streptomyces populi]|uniref:UvrD-like helicase ATP-binding domain-containing protein n=1 Tax=Streptomyces populi TaxID=2058924 RepID=A0A2I0SY51_9ACTN|nr:hypothetical protein CW362_00270 [Streptomyces populi]